MEPTSKMLLSLFLGFAKTTAVLVWHTLFWYYNSWRLFQASAPLKQKYALGAIELNSLNWLAGLSQEKQFLFVVRKKSCSEAGRRHLWRFVSVDKFLSALRQVGRTWRGQLMTGIWRNFLVIKTNLSKFCPKCDLGLNDWQWIIYISGLAVHYFLTSN